jgi:uncharacterized protein (DUF1697 family)
MAKNMARYAVLLRAVNLGSHQKVAMADLRRVLESLGHTEVETYLQSGNAVVTNPDRNPERVARDIRAGLSKELGLDTPVLVRTGSDLAAVIADNPFPDAASTPLLLHVAFLSAQPEPDRMAKLDPAAYAPDEFRLGERVIYLRYATGSGRSKLNQSAFARLKVDATARNWNTVTALARMTST